MDNNVIISSPLPAKTWFHSYDSEFLTARKKELNDYCKVLENQADLFSGGSKHFCHLKNFLTDGLQFDEARLVTIHGPRYRMLIIGAGQLSRYLCQIAVGLDYQVTVCDPREEYSEEWSIPGVAMVRTMPDDTVMAMKLDERCAVIALTHDPKLDDLALMEALKTPAFYVGALGSRRNNANRRERLKEFDLSDAELARLLTVFAG